MPDVGYNAPGGAINAAAGHVIHDGRWLRDPRYLDDYEAYWLTGPGRDAPRRMRYFKKARHEIVRLGLESELEIVRTWPASLKTEPEAALQALGAHLEADIITGEAAVAERRNAAATTSDQRVREIVRFVDDINASRRTRYGLLIQRAEERGLPADWPGRFFKKSTQGPKKVKTAPATGGQPA